MTRKWGLKPRRPVPDYRHQHDAIMAKIKARIVVTDGGCWQWQGFSKGGYGQTWWERPITVSRLIYAAVYGAFDVDMDICHTCDNPGCCNPQHLFVAEHADNMMDSIEKRRHAESERTHCPQGHEYTPENTEIKLTGKRGKGISRACRACQRARVRIRNGWPKDLAYSTPALPHCGASPRREQTDQV